MVCVQAPHHRCNMPENGEKSGTHQGLGPTPLENIYTHSSTCQMLERAKFMHSSDRQTTACSLPAFMLERERPKTEPSQKISRNPIEEKNWQHCSRLANPLTGRALSLFPPPIRRRGEIHVLMRCGRKKKVISKARDSNGCLNRDSHFNWRGWKYKNA